MAQTASKKKKQKAIDEYNKQSLLIQRLVWLYYLGERTHNAEGLNPGGVVGGTTDYAIAGNIKQYLEPRNFGYSAKKACQIALDLHAEGETILEVPDLEDKNTALQQQRTPAPDQAPAGRDTIRQAFEIEIEGEVEEEEEEEEEFIYQTPQKKQPATMPTVDDITTDLAKANLGSISRISMPVVWGHYEYNTYTDRREIMVYKYRFLTHNFVVADDIDKLWLNARTLQVRIASPPWWENPENQAMFETKDQVAVMVDDAGEAKSVNVKVPLYDLQHKLIGSMMTNNEKRKDVVTGRIYDTGIFKFNTDMDITADESHVELYPLTIKGVTGQFISVRVQVDVKPLPSAKKKPLKAKQTAQHATVGTGKSIDPDGVKVGEDGYDDVEYARFTRLYNSYDKIPPAKEKLKHFRGVESNLFYLVSLLLENDVELLDQGDFVEQVMSQFAGQPVQMMTYAESVIAERAVARRSPPITTLTIDSMDTTRDHSKRRREEPPLTRQQSRNNILEGID